jgi:3-oxoacyl-[acyl-carrier-protein] synthase III
MDGPQIVAFAIEKVIPKLKEFIVKKNITLLMHQAGKIIIELVKNSVIKKKKIFFPTNFRNFGNLVSTSIPLILYQNFRKVNLSKEIIICGFGVGLTHTHIMLKKN